VSIEVVALVGFLFVPPMAHVLEHAPSPAAGWAVSLLAVPVLLLVDRTHESSRARRRGR
jgi:hypothetical protein